MAETKYNITLRAKDKTAREFQKLNRNIDHTQKAMKKIAGAFAGAFAVSQLVRFGDEALKVADTIGKVADSLDVNTSFLQKYQFAAQQSGLTTEEFNKGLQNFTKMVGQAQLRTSEAGRTLEKLGVQVKNADGSVKGAEEVFIDLFHALDDVGDQFQKNAILADLMGRAGVKLSVLGKNGAEAMEALAESATGVLDEETIRRAERFNDTMNILKRSILAPIQTLFINAANSVLLFMDAIGLIDVPKTMDELQEELRKATELQEKFIKASSRKRSQAGLKDQTDAINLIKKEIEALEKLEKTRSNVATAMEEAKSQAKAITAVASTLTSSFTNFFDVTKKGFLDFGNLAEQVLRSVISEMIKMFVVKKVLGGIGSALGTKFGEGNVFAQVFSKAAESFQGGGFTGTGSRTGGVDGRGGFPAILHPNETVVDHTQGQSMGATVNFNITTVDAASFDNLLASRKGLITQIINNAMNTKGKRGVV